MKKILFRILVVCAFVFAFSAAANAQSNNITKSAVQRGGSNPATIIVGTAAKAAWGTTKFVAKHVAKPAAKSIFMKALPAVTKFTLKQSAKHLLPTALKIAAL